MIRESLADSNQIQWQVLAKSLQLQLTDSRLWQVLYIYSIRSQRKVMRHVHLFNILNIEDIICNKPRFRFALLFCFYCYV